MASVVASRYTVEAHFNPSSLRTHQAEVFSVKEHLHGEFPFANSVVLTNAAGALVDLYQAKQKEGTPQAEYEGRSAEIITAVRQSDMLGRVRYRELVTKITEDPGFRLHMHDAIENAIRSIEEFVNMQGLKEYARPSPFTECIAESPPLLKGVPVQSGNYSRSNFPVEMRTRRPC